MRDRVKRLRLFARRLAEYLAGDQARRSIELEMGRPGAVEWAELRGLTPLAGYPTVDEAEKALLAFFGLED
jgi:hypothetical protein